MAADEELAWIATERCGVFVNPRHGTPHLIRHHAKIAICGFDGNKVEREVVRAGIDENFGREGVVFRRTAKPGAALDEDEDRSIWPLGTIDVELFNLAWAIRFTLRLSEPTRVSSLLLA